MADNEVMVAGKKVILRSYLPSRDYIGIIRGIMNLGNIGDLPFEEQVKPLMPLVESWEFEGEPDDLEAWGKLDALSELMPIFNAIGEHVARKTSGEEAKN
jgi:hypothetical protein